MRQLFAAATAVSLMVSAGAALAQSGQGGYTGANPGASSPTTPGQPPGTMGSGQGGYLGKDPAAGATSSGGSGVMGSGQGGYTGVNPGAVTPPTGTSPATGPGVDQRR